MTRRAYSVSEVAQQLGVSERTVRRMADDGRLRVVKLGRLIRVPADALEVLLDVPAVRPKQSARSRAATAWLDSIRESGPPAVPVRSAPDSRTA